MTDQAKDGGPAYPQYQAGSVWVTGTSGNPSPIMETTGGMSLRDWFAGQALPALLTRFMEDGSIGTQPWTVAYQVADEMLAERVKHADATP